RRPSQLERSETGGEVEGGMDVRAPGEGIESCESRRRAELQQRAVPLDDRVAPSNLGPRVRARAKHRAGELGEPCSIGYGMTGTLNPEPQRVAAAIGAQRTQTLRGKSRPDRCALTVRSGKNVEQTLGLGGVTCGAREGAGCAAPVGKQQRHD